MSRYFGNPILHHVWCMNWDEDTQSRSRTCTAGRHGGSDCVGNSTESQACNEQPCPGRLYIPSVRPTVKMFNFSAQDLPCNILIASKVTYVVKAHRPEADCIKLFLLRSRPVFFNMKGVAPPPFNC